MNVSNVTERSVDGAATDFIVAIVDDDQLVRNSIALWLRTNGFVTRSFAAASDFMNWITPATTTVIVTDVRMPDMDGISLMAALRAAQCAQPVIVITGHADVALAVEAMKAGAAEFLEKPFAMEKLVAAVDRCSVVLSALNREFVRKAAIDDLLRTLSPRETQVLDALVEGHSNKAIAAKLKISPRTVEIHRANVMTKMRVSSIPELVKLAVSSART